jgi:antitoxin (DNA-binding transcriptional repressor) of toxin-antitoxin stability system
MKSVQVADLRERLDECVEAVKNGETVTLLEGQKRIGELKPEETDEERLARLERAGIIRRGTGKLPPDFLTRELPKFGGSVVEQLLEDRRKKDW